MQSAGDKAAQFFTRLKENATEFLAVFTAGKGFKEFLTDVTQADATLGRLAKSIDSSAKELGTWQEAAKLSGGSADATTASLVGLNRALNNAQLRGSLPDFIAQFRAMGIPLADSANKVQNITELMFEFNRAAQQMDPARFSAMMAPFLDQGTINLLLKSTTEFRKVFEEAQKVAPTNADAKAAEQRQEAWAKLLETWTQVGRELTTNLTPALLAIDRALQGIGDWAEKHPQAVETAFLGIAAAVGVMSTMLAVRAVGAVLALAGAFVTLRDAAAGAAAAEAVATGGAVGGGAAAAAAGGGFWGTLGRFATGALGRIGGPLGFYFGSTSGLNEGEDEDARRRRFGIPVGPGNPFGGLGRARGLFAPTSSSSAAPDDFYSTVIAAEGTGRNGDPYNTSLNYVASPIPLTQMTMGESLQWGDYIRATQGVNSSAKGAFQLENSTQRDAMKALGLTASDLFNEDNQRRMADWVRQHQGLGAWEGFKAHPDLRRKAQDLLNAAPASAPPSIGAPGSAIINNDATSSSRGGNNSQTTIGEVHVHTPATDGQGVARDFMDAIRRSTYASHANTSLA